MAVCSFFPPGHLSVYGNKWHRIWTSTEISLVLPEVSDFTAIFQLLDFNWNRHFHLEVDKRLLVSKSAASLGHQASLPISHISGTWKVV